MTSTFHLRVAGVTALAFAGLLIGVAWLVDVVSTSPELPGEGLSVTSDPLPVSATSRFSKDLNERLAEDRTRYAGLLGRVVNASGVPMAGIAVTCEGSTAVSASDGSFALVGDSQSRPRAVLPEGLIAVESPLLSLLREQETTLVVMPGAPLFGQVVDEEERPVAGARVSLELTLPLSGLDGVRRATLVSARTVSDADGRFAMRDAPIGEGVSLVMRSPDGRTLRQTRDARGFARYMFGPDDRTAPPARPAPASPIRSLAGTLLEEDGHPLAFCWVVARPVAQAAVHAEGAIARLLPVCTDQDGRFLIPDAACGRVRFEAWRTDNRAVYRSDLVAASTDDHVVTVKAASMPARIRGRVLDLDGRPQAGVVVGLARPSGWGFQGALAMLANHRVTTDIDGCFVLDPCGTPALEICVDGHGIVPARASILKSGDAMDLEVRAMPRRWLAGPQPSAAPYANAELVALDAAGCALPIWGRQPSIARMSWPLRLRGRMALARTTRTLVLRCPEGDCGWLELAN